MHDQIANLAVTAISSIFLILCIVLILLRYFQKSPGMALCLIGVFMAIAAAVQASVSGLSLNQNPGQFAMATAPSSGPLSKIAVILVLGGVGMLFLSRSSAPPVGSNKTETTDVA